MLASAFSLLLQFNSHFPYRRPTPSPLRSALLSRREGRGAGAKSSARRNAGTGESGESRLKGAFEFFSFLSCFHSRALRLSTATFFFSTSTTLIPLLNRHQIKKNSQEALPPWRRRPPRDPQVPALDRAADQEAAFREAGVFFPPLLCFLRPTTPGFSKTCSSFSEEVSFLPTQLTKTKKNAHDQPAPNSSSGARDHQWRGPGAVPMDSRGAAGAAGGKWCLFFLSFFFLCFPLVVLALLSFPLMLFFFSLSLSLSLNDEKNKRRRRTLSCTCSRTPTCARSTPSA